MRWAIALLIAGCSSGASPAHPTPPTPHPIDAGPLAEAPIGERECDELFDHALALGLAEQRAAKLVTADDAQAQVRSELHAELVAACRGLPREVFRCALAAPTLDAVAACQASRSSSTSNSNVAPGGILPPAAPVAP